MREAEDLSEDEKEAESFPNRIDLRFKFQERNFDFYYIGLEDMLSSLGGVGAILNEIIGSFGTVLILVFFADLIYMLRKKHNYELTKFQSENIKKKLPEIIDAAKQMRIDNNSDQYDEDIKVMQKMNELFMARLEREKKEKEALAAKVEGKEVDEEETPKEPEKDDWFPYKAKEGEDVKKLSDNQKAMQKFEFLVRVEKEYGERSRALNKVYDYILDDFQVTRQILKDR